MVFTTRMREQIISEVQTKPILWNDRHKDFKNTEKTKNCGKKWEKHVDYQVIVHIRRT